MSVIGSRIASRRALLRMTQAKLAKDAEMDRTYLGLIEAGQGNPTVAMFIKLASALGISPGDLLDGRDLGQPAVRADGPESGRR
ncbi:MAG: helix-turn-helix transcriptional regulator [Cellulomonadaceae bacterium]|nr:helix-turn-helix transcriptional regulator [Cellulomonadaceae bacterium]